MRDKCEMLMRRAASRRQTRQQRHAATKVQGVAEYSASRVEVDIESVPEIQSTIEDATKRVYVAVGRIRGLWEKTAILADRLHGSRAEAVAGGLLQEKTATKPACGPALHLSLNDLEDIIKRLEAANARL